jgi:transcriptional regulator with XRE-family HTH domain
MTSALRLETRREIAQFVEARRTERGLSQHQLAQQADVSQSSICRLEAASSSTKVDTFIMVLRAFGLNIQFDGRVEALIAERPIVARAIRVLLTLPQTAERDTLIGDLTILRTKMDQAL